MFILTKPTQPVSLFSTPFGKCLLQEERSGPHYPSDAHAGCHLAPQFGQKIISEEGPFMPEQHCPLLCHKRLGDVDTRRALGLPFARSSPIHRFLSGGFPYGFRCRWFLSDLGTLIPDVQLGLPFARSSSIHRFLSGGFPLRISVSLVSRP